ncbi:macrolide family glycosyltransferase [Streptomyces sp. NPDC015127]|uniref:macrolide family glycosyltransferase n=1 Tax=Streptomyces sp. NPDC015127 TaxID=3364939 RepID=UPI0036FDCFD4
MPASATTASSAPATREPAIRQQERPGSGGAHIAVFGVPMPGHINPTLAVVEELVARGHRVSYAMTDEFAPLVKSVGAEPVVYPDAVPGEHQTAENVNRHLSLSLVQTAHALGPLAAAYADDRPDLVLHDVLAWSGLMLARQWKVPSVLSSPTHLPYEGVIPEMFGVADIYDIEGIPEVEPALAHYGITATAREVAFSHERAVAYFPSVFQRRLETVAVKSAAFVGPVIGDRSFQGSWQPPADGRPVLFVSLGTVCVWPPEFFRACVDAFADLPWHTVVSVGRSLDPLSLGPLPDNMEVHASVPQLRVLAHARAFVTHAGMGGTMEAAHHGVPMVAIPQTAEQQVNADQIEKLNLGVHLPPGRLSPRALREAVLHVASSPVIARGITAMRRHLDETGGATAAADALESHLP